MSECSGEFERYDLLREIVDIGVNGTKNWM